MSADDSSASVNSSEMWVAMSGSIIPTPLAIPTTRAVLPAHDRLGELRDRVGGHHPARRTIGIVGGECAGQRVDAGADPLDRIATADHAGRGDHDVGRLAPETLRDALRHLDRVGVALRPGRHVGVLRDDHDGVCLTVGDLGAAEGDARTGEPAPGEHAGHRDGAVGGDHHEVVGVVLDADVRDVAAETEWERGHGSSPALIDWKIEANAST